MTRSRLVALGSVLGLFVWLFWEVLFLPNNFVYRDAAHFFYPLFELVQEEWSAGRIPLWNPYENCGEPLLANGTSSVLYPGKFIFALPLSFPWAYKFYILGHLLLAAGGAYFLARRWHASVEAAALCSLSYAFSGNVLFQYCNVVFLCGAAWLPVALWAGDAMLRSRRYDFAALLGLVLALMTLAGDAQLAYVAGSVVALNALLLWRAARQTQATQRPVPRKLRRGKQAPAAAHHQTEPIEPATSWQRSYLALLAAAACWSAGLGAAQVLPTAELTRLSDRAYFDLPRSVYEIPAYLVRDHAPPRRRDGRQSQWYDAMLGDPPLPLAHSECLYDFSVSPWRLAEYVWPNFSGRKFPLNRRWLGAVSREGGFWTPSLYMGLLPLLLALGTWRLRRVEARIAWLSWLVLLGTLAALGSYGLGWGWRHLIGSKAVADPVGGLYWLMTVLLPGFVQFRYPAKLVVVAALGLSGLAAVGWDRLMAGDWQRFDRLLKIAAAVSVLGLLLWAAVAPWWDGWLADKGEPYYGPLDASAAYWQLGGSLLQTLVVAAALWWIICSIRSVAPAPHPNPLPGVPGRGGQLGGTRWAQAAVLLTTIDIAVAQRWMVLAAPTENWQTKPRVAALLDEAERQRPAVDGDAAQPFRLMRFGEGQPASWATSFSPTRPVMGQQWEWDTLQPKYPLPYRRSMVRTVGSIGLYDYDFFLAPSMRLDPIEYVQPRRALDALGAKYLIVRRDVDAASMTRSSEGLHLRWRQPPWLRQHPQGSPEGPPLEPAVAAAQQYLGSLADEIEVLYNDSHFPRAWIVRDLLVTPRLASHDRARLMPILQSILFPVDHWLDLRQTAWVEDDELTHVAEQGRLRLPAGEPQGESCRVVSQSPGRLELEATLSAPGLVVLAETHYPGWTLAVETGGQTRAAPILRTNRVMRGTLLPAGKHKLVYEYRPLSFYLGAIVSLLTVALLVLGCLLTLLRRRRAQTMPIGTP